VGAAAARYTHDARISVRFMSFPPEKAGSLGQQPNKNTAGRVKAATNRQDCMERLPFVPCDRVAIRGPSLDVNVTAG